VLWSYRVPTSASFVSSEDWTPFTPVSLATAAASNVFQIFKFSIFVYPSDFGKQDVVISNFCHLTLAWLTWNNWFSTLNKGSEPFLHVGLHTHSYYSLHGFLNCLYPGRQITWCCSSGFFQLNLVSQTYISVNSHNMDNLSQKVLSFKCFLHTEH